MSIELYCSNIHSHSNTVFNNASFPTNKIQSISSERDESLFKKLMRKRAQTKENAIKNKPFKDFNKKPSILDKIQDAKELLKKNKCKYSSTHSNKKMCFCFPPTHEVPYRCILHRISATKRTQTKENAIKNKPFKDFNKKPSILDEIQDAKDLLKKNKCKYSSTHSNKMCFCSPTTHEVPYRCRLHRISATKKSSTEENNVMRCSKFKPQLSRFGRVATSAEVVSNNSFIQPSECESS